MGLLISLIRLQLSSLHVNEFADLMALKIALRGFKSAHRILAQGALKKVCLFVCLLNYLLSCLDALRAGIPVG